MSYIPARRDHYDRRALAVAYLVQQHRAITPDPHDSLVGEAHLDILDALLRVFLGDRAEQVFTSIDLRAKGVAGTPPSGTASPWDFEVD